MTSKAEYPGPHPGLCPRPVASPLADDLLEGGAEIARFLYGDANRRPRVYELIRHGRPPLPVFRLGGVICARKSALFAWIAEKEGQGRAGGETSKTSVKSRGRRRHRSGSRPTHEK